MKKLLAIGVMLTGLAGAASAACNPTPVITPIVGSVAGTAVVPFLSAVGNGAFVVYANATGIAFPLCGRFGLQCYGGEENYPHGKNGG